ncbi:hypothetical protein [Zunongwangia pacifica]|uniref:Uncharacterized protein n=1 Tax=Zunongwangia pacifica TaxID=2911062 RepID=A0A9X1ZYF2_9FLAO|nr:hypothetical protein [Zunongwangia pacifica]MCL6220888.1 hypothetical protein [Zunongwangia pacifica]
MKKLPLINLILLIGIITYLLISSDKKQEYKENEIIPEITTERLNIVGKDGNKYVVLSNPEKQALATINGKPIDSEQTERNVAGLLFFNEDGDEIGGLTYGIDSTDSYQLLTFDQRKNDQIMTLRKDEYLENGKWKKRYGLLLQERSEKQSDVIISELNNIRKIKDSIFREKEYDKFYNNPENLAPQRLFIGRTYSENVGLFLMDKNNKPRLQIYLDEDGEPHIESFDKNGEKKIIK